MADMIIPDTLPGPEQNRWFPIASLVDEAAELLRIPAKLPAPSSVDVHGSCQHINLVFDPEPASFAAIAAWSDAYGGVLASQPYTTKAGEPVTICCAQFEFYGVAVEALAVIPAATAAT